LTAEALDTPIQCRHCDAKVPASAAIAFDGADYVRHFCGEDCLAQWCQKWRHGDHAG